MWWLTPVIPAFWKLRQEDHEFKSSISFIVSLKSAWVTRDLILENKTRVWRDGSVVKSIYYSSRGPKFSSQPLQVAHNRL